MRLIDADELVKHIENKVDMQDVYSPLHIIQFIHREPTISPCVGMKCGYEDQCPNIPHGEWIPSGVDISGHRLNRCSICNGVYQMSYVGDSLIRWHFCPNCGVSMRKGET
jgi:hypothetical protein